MIQQVHYNAMTIAGTSKAISRLLVSKQAAFTGTTMIARSYQERLNLNINGHKQLGTRSYSSVNRGETDKHQQNKKTKPNNGITDSDEFDIDLITLAKKPKQTSQSDINSKGNMNIKKESQSHTNSTSIGDLMSQGRVIIERPGDNASGSGKSHNSNLKGSSGKAHSSSGTRSSGNGIRKRSGFGGVKTSSRSGGGKFNPLKNLLGGGVTNGSTTSRLENDRESGAEKRDKNTGYSKEDEMGFKDSKEKKVVENVEVSNQNDGAATTATVSASTPHKDNTVASENDPKSTHESFNTTEPPKDKLESDSTQVNRDPNVKFDEPMGYAYFNGLFKAEQNYLKDFLSKQELKTQETGKLLELFKKLMKFKKSVADKERVLLFLTTLNRNEQYLNYFIWLKFGVDKRKHAVSEKFSIVDEEELSKELKEEPPKVTPIAKETVVKPDETRARLCL
ncbi:unnamed protein product [Ambrosiozyma monospora]|uniref:Unnamed protein product n=1 Tax=Ambrosiozyma monospora TaxID=43982 RepID=A0ACB5T4C2_AMBMO|nr:unnamed protein product [Ambrosiozyma monospora]